VHALTIDVEAFAESRHERVAVPGDLLATELLDREITRNLETALALLAEFDLRATFFFLGRIAQSSPELIRCVAEAGHEIGCHSQTHTRIVLQRPESFRADLTAAKARLEDVSGQAVIGFRAPFFSIVEGSMWAVDELAAAGFHYDSSIVPIRQRLGEHITDVSESIFRWPNGLVEFPMPVIRLPGTAVPIGGGGYFRLFPVSMTARAFRRRERRGEAAAFYAHPYEIGSVAPRLPGLTPYRRLQYYIGYKRGAQRLRRLFKAVKFGTMQEVLRERGFLAPA
jgi:polysaccharide deacetylase family protein (PEP-CTERM system associated)